MNFDVLWDKLNDKKINATTCDKYLPVAAVDDVNTYTGWAKKVTPYVFLLIFRPNVKFLNQVLQA